jgi:hypothetical protein
MTEGRAMHLVPHPHWDREWYEPFQRFRLRLVDLLDDVLDRAEEDSRFHFTLDGQMAAVDDYLEVREEHRERVAALVKAGQLAGGELAGGELAGGELAGGELAGGELALTVARCTGALSRNVHRYREQPAGPQIPIPAAQLVGTTRAARRVRPGAQPSTDPATGIRLTRRIWLSARRPAQDASRTRLDG